MSAASVPASIASNHGAGAGSTPSAALQSLQVRPTTSTRYLVAPA
jgi:hypothetical protein